MPELRIYGADPEDLGRREQLAVDLYEDGQPDLETIAGCPCCGPSNGYGHVLACKTHQADLFREVLEERRKKLVSDIVSDTFP